jgi:hypothetical protein
MIAEGRGRLSHVKAVGWIRNRAGDDNHWTTRQQQTVTSPSSASFAPAAASASASAASSSRASALLEDQQRSAPPTAHPALVAFQQEQARAEAKAQAVRAANIEGRTSSSVYGAHTYARPLSEGGVGDAKINEIGAEQILQQQSRLWGSLDATSKRLGFGISNAPRGSDLSALEAEQDRRRFLSVNAVSYTRTGKEKAPVIAVPDSMNRTTPLFPLHPVNAYAADRAKPKPTGVAAADLAAAAAAAAAGNGNTNGEEQKEQSQQRGASRSGGGATSPSAAARAAAVADMDGSSTAHALGYGSRHSFFRHYLSSAP